MTKPDSRLPSLPSISELINHPTVKGIVERLNQSTVAQRATGFLEELRNSLRERTEKGMVPTAEQLAERFARHLLGANDRSHQIINATGVVGGEAQLVPPLAEAALHQMLLLVGEYHSADSSLYDWATGLLCRVTGSEAATIVPTFAQAVTLCSQVSDANVALARDAGILDPQQWGLQSVPTLAERLQDVDLVVAEGSGLLGGPPCGLVLGNCSSIARVTESGEAALGVDAASLVALASTLEIYAAEDRVIHQIPVWQLLSTPLENLRQRCERLAPLVENAVGVSRATAQAAESSWWNTSGNSFQASTWQIAIRPAELPLEEAAERLASGSPKISFRTDDESLILDMRSVFPRWDQQLVSAVEMLLQ